MIISDLSYLEEAFANVVGGQGGDTKIDIDVEFDKDIKITEDLNIDKLFKVETYVDGNSAVADATAQAHGEDSLAQTFTVAFATDTYSDAFSQSVAVVGPSCSPC
jgi:hypothetical protein